MRAEDGFTPDVLEAVFHKALSEGDVKGVEAALTVMAGRDPARMVRLADQLRAALTIADRQPYPTVDAYEAACRALEKHRARADAAETALATAERDALRRIERPGSVLCDCDQNDSEPTNPCSGARIDHHCECPAVQAAATALGAHRLTVHASQCECSDLYADYDRAAAVGTEETT